MDWNFSIGWFLLGTAILAAGAAIVVFYRQISDNFLTSGISGYDKVKLWGIITCVIGLLVMTNLHTVILSAFVNIVFKR
ncbi:hypothetical protein IJI55_01800 [Candidatus Saccharibacteria bacterium]|nr:hypothetical protein [Candidatus Saccharibacteria bacterium]MBR3323321.1 hypothetical protein [Candidatus Saccharibacteria bacterium]